MRKTALIIFVSILAFACTKEISTSDITKINGYWEIEKVVFPDGTQKEYAINETYDYFEVKNNSGFRKKVAPQLDGTFLVDETYEKIVIKKEQEQYFIHYNTAFSNWKEELRAVSDEKMILINNVNNEYHYKRANPINILNNGEKTQ
jgi:hypothetical protein